MKKIAITALLAASLASNAFAINVPFIKAPVPADGLTLSYDTNGTEKVVCATEGFYKGYVFITENGVEKDTHIAFGNHDGQQFYFTSIGSNTSHGDLDQLHVDTKGLIKFVNTNYPLNSPAYVSCFYIPETAK